MTAADDAIQKFGMAVREVVDALRAVAVAMAGLQPVIDEAIAYERDFSRWLALIDVWAPYEHERAGVTRADIRQQLMTHRGLVLSLWNRRTVLIPIEEILERHADRAPSMEAQRAR